MERGCSDGLSFFVIRPKLNFNLRDVCMLEIFDFFGIDSIVKKQQSKVQQNVFYNSSPLSNVHLVVPLIADFTVNLRIPQKLTEMLVGGGVKT